MAAMMNLDTKAAQKLQSKGGDLNKLYATKPKAIYFWLLYREVTGRNSTFAKKRFWYNWRSPEAMEATNKAALAQHINDYNLGVNMEAERTVGEIDEDDTEVG